MGKKGVNVNVKYLRLNWLYTFFFSKLHYELLILKNLREKHEKVIK